MTPAESQALTLKLVFERGSDFKLLQRYIEEAYQKGFEQGYAEATEIARWGPCVAAVPAAPPLPPFAVSVPLEA